MKAKNVMLVIWIFIIGIVGCYTLEWNLRLISGIFLLMWANNIKVK